MKSYIIATLLTLTLPFYAQARPYTEGQCLSFGSMASVYAKALAGNNGSRVNVVAQNEFEALIRSEKRLPVEIRDTELLMLRWVYLVRPSVVEAGRVAYLKCKMGDWE